MSIAKKKSPQTGRKSAGTGQEKKSFTVSTRNTRGSTPGFSAVAGSIRSLLERTKAYLIPCGK